MYRRLPLAWSRLGGRRDESGQGEEEDVLMTAAAMLSHRGRQWGDPNGKEEEVEEDDNNVTVTALGGVRRQNGRFDESSMLFLLTLSLSPLLGENLVIHHGVSQTFSHFDC